MGIFPRKEEIKVGHYTSPLAGALAQPASLQSRRNPIKKIQARRRFVLQFPMISVLFFSLLFLFKASNFRGHFVCEAEESDFTKNSIPSFPQGKNKTLKSPIVF